MEICGGELNNNLGREKKEEEDEKKKTKQKCFAAVLRVINMN